MAPVIAVTTTTTTTERKVRTFALLLLAVEQMAHFAHHVLVDVETQLELIVRLAVAKQLLQLAQLAARVVQFALQLADSFISLFCIPNGVGWI